MSADPHRCACQSSYHVAACPGVFPACGGSPCSAYPDYGELLAPGSEFEAAVSEFVVSGPLPAADGD